MRVSLVSLGGGLSFVLSGLGVLDTLNLEKGGVGVSVALATLVRQVLALDVDCANCQYSGLGGRDARLDVRR